MTDRQTLKVGTVALGIIFAAQTLTGAGIVHVLWTYFTFAVMGYVYQHEVKGRKP